MEGLQANFHTRVKFNVYKMWNKVIYERKIIACRQEVKQEAFRDVTSTSDITQEIF